MSDDSETTLFAEEDVSELYFVFIADINANDNNYDLDVKHLLSYHNDPKTKQKYVDVENSFKDVCNKQGINDNYNKLKQ
eukprot:14495010-Ditylum_brightwellii.AAC.1